MTATTAPAALLAPARPPLGRLVAVELRKMVDTRSGRWLLVLIAVAGVALMPVVLFTVDEPDQSVVELFVASQTGAAILLPVLGILSVTAEWSQRTALSTFALVPERNRVLTAKLAAGTVLAAVFLVLGIAVAVLTRALGGALGRSGGSWSLPASLVGTMLLFTVLMVMMGAAFGMLFMNSPVAIVLYFVLPSLWSTLGEMIQRLKGPAGWLDTNRTLDVLTQEGVSGGEWARIGASLAVWLLLPLAAGAVRLARREVK
ncbi:MULTISPECIES: ABC transporter permease [Thermomonosporaceae]|uniref:ABC transporter permease n=1 Tax=Thermomonosporaceae TaxID=2012 RepID=UPI00255B083C|nr:MULTISPECIES: ABC transporter permease [Thermomonosporaceae]MDL4777167.1 ABC transporter permease [Actinomadura xylanilytica]